MTLSWEINTEVLRNHMVPATYSKLHIYLIIEEEGKNDEADVAKCSG